MNQPLEVTGNAIVDSLKVEIYRWLISMTLRL